VVLGRDGTGVVECRERDVDFLRPRVVRVGQACSAGAAEPARANVAQATNGAPLARRQLAQWQ
jgi:hypothetical protein